MSRPTTLLGPLDGLTADQINHRFATLVAGMEWGTLPLLDEIAFAAITAELANRPRLFTFVDLFCGAGGSSTGLVMAGGLLLFAANHSKNNIAIHSKNHPDAEHACADLDHYDMRNIPGGADVLWASPICTELSPAGGNGKGKKPKAPKQRRPKHTAVLGGQGELEIEGHVPQEDYIRTRATFWDVIRATEVHGFKYVIVENVVEAAWKWRLFPSWLMVMQALGYGYQLVSVSAAHVGDALNPHAPQRRDRMYVVFHRLDCPKPDLELRPMAHCEKCGLVEGVKFWKKKDGTLTASGQHMQVGKYGVRSGQYYYTCPNVSAHIHDSRNGRPVVVTPLERPAASVIDWSDLGVPIGERAEHGLDPLVVNTIARVQKGIQTFGRPVHLAGAGNTYERPGSGYVRAWPADGTPFMAQQTTVTTGIAWPPFIDATGGSWNTEPYTVGDRAFRTQMANPKGCEALVCPPLIVNHAHTDDRVDPADARALPAATTKIGHGLVVPPFLVTNKSDGGRPQDRISEVDEPFGAVTTGRHQSLVTPSGAVPPGAFVDTMRNNVVGTSPWEAVTAITAGGNNHGLVVPYNRTGVARPADLYAMPTMHTVDGAGLATPGDVDFDVMKARYRTLKWWEQARAQRFPATYQWVGTSGQRTAGAGNAVASNVACWLGQRVAAALNRTAANA